jgi:hypothetical protein
MTSLYSVAPQLASKEKFPEKYKRRSSFSRSLSYLQTEKLLLPIIVKLEDDIVEVLQ